MPGRGSGKEFPSLALHRACHRRPTATSMPTPRGLVSAAIVSTRTRLAPTSRRLPTAWVNTNIRSKGPLGKLYPRAVLYPRGRHAVLPWFDQQRACKLHEPELRRLGRPLCVAAPSTASHVRSGRRAATRSRAATTRRIPSRGVDGRTYTSDQATIWRWRSGISERFCRAHGLDGEGSGTRRITTRTSS